MYSQESEGDLGHPGRLTAQRLVWL
ncbi:protein of unknown function [Candidatus Nitrospira inopinata]|uniref:Uncharacterized protein n=1 Tax=Candidatus Nitrospira inopinata TaxID=1715989 RepID=A0A0S4KRK3_9BACT|nr:protein of unknown function [Candidatus Nitrospira inopinata]